MDYFVTGATGFIGKRLVKKLLEGKGGRVYFLIRKESAGKVTALRKYRGVRAARVIPIQSDLTRKKLGVSFTAINMPLVRPPLVGSLSFGSGNLFCRGLRPIGR